MILGSRRSGRVPGAVESLPEHRHRGVSVIELLVVLALLSLVVQLGWTVLSGQRRAATALSVRAEGLETVRTVGWLLPEELSGGEPERDWWVAGDSIGLRAFRGVGFVLGDSVRGDRVRVCYRGIRSPAPEKDSVLFLGIDGRWRAHDLVSRALRPGACVQTADAWEEEWVVSPEAGRSVLVRLFERGSYHLSSGALRYRRGAGGRQPLTPERILEGNILVPSSPGGRVGWEALLSSARPEGTGGSWRGVVW